LKTERINIRRTNFTRKHTTSDFRKIIIERIIISAYNIAVLAGIVKICLNIKIS
jgi:hypothetical protein